MRESLVEALKARSQNAELDAEACRSRGDVPLTQYFQGRAEAYLIAAEMAESDWYSIVH